MLRPLAPFRMRPVQQPALLQKKTTKPLAAVAVHKKPRPVKGMRVSLNQPLRREQSKLRVLKNGAGPQSD